MRVATMIDPESGKPFIAYAVHRFGSPRSGFTDNVQQGGITAKIDLKNGRLSMAHFYTKEGHKEIFEKHPGSQAIIFNQQIPDWDSIKERIIEMSCRMPYLKYVGWDFILTDDQLYVLEGNVASGLGLVQLYNPMKEYPDAWKFFRHYGYV
ncbi:MAG: sugar-transfer associated ATP-grasp domain-containing protein [Bacteroidales bacterium]|nr:sugar-transfer associated ATP-grasp domain-containing protein [Bacteroidales bacterium]